MTALSKNIRYLRKKKQWSQDYVAEKLGYRSYTTIQKWEMGTSEPPLKTTKKLADLFGVDIDDLTNIDLEAPPPMQETVSAVSIPVLGRVAAGVPITAVEYIVDMEEITQEMARAGTHYGLVIRGDSMEPRICDGDVVIVRQQSTAESGDIVIALVNGSDATCKRLKKYEDGIALISFNSAYHPMFFSSKEIESMPVQIIGKVVELRGKFE